MRLPSNWIRLPGLDLRAARLSQARRFALLPQGQDHQAAAQAVLHVRRGAVNGVAHWRSDPISRFSDAGEKKIKRSDEIVAIGFG